MPVPVGDQNTSVYNLMPKNPAHMNDDYQNNFSLANFYSSFVKYVYYDDGVIGFKAGMERHDKK